MLPKVRKEKKIKERKELLGFAQCLERTTDENREPTFNMDSKEDYYRIIDSKRH